MNREYIGTLYQIYGGLLNEKQNFAIRLYYFEDFSLTEICEHTNTSKQAVSNLLKRSEDLLLSFERELGLYEKSNILRKELTKIIDDLNNDDINREEIIFTLSNLVENI